MSLSVVDKLICDVMVQYKLEAIHTAVLYKFVCLKLILTQLLHSLGFHR